MKVLKHILIFALPVFFIAGCQKSTVRPHKCGGNESQVQTTPSETSPASITTNDESNEQVLMGRASLSSDSAPQPAELVVPTENDEPVENSPDLGTPGENEPIDVSGGGDDDRDGGEKKRKR